tara:strand:- start:10789 stop:11343 length:555 start_codon:yes stop_codon:yes gene_type:complete
MKIRTVTFSLLIFILAAYQANAEIVYKSGGYTFRLNEIGYSISGGPSIAWAKDDSVNLVMGGTKSLRQAKWIYDNAGTRCLAVRYKFSQFQMFGVARTNSQTLVNFCPKYIAMSKKFGFAPLVVPLVNDKDVTVSPIEAASPFNFLSSLGFGYTCVYNSGSKAPCKLYGPGISGATNSNEWVVQ